MTFSRQRTLLNRLNEFVLEVVHDVVHNDPVVSIVMNLSVFYLSAEQSLSPW